MTHRHYKRNRAKPERVERAKARQAVSSAQTPAERLAALENRGHGHCAEAVKLREEYVP